MKKEAVKRVLKTLTPCVTIQKAYDTRTGIVLEVKHEYAYPDSPDGHPIPWVKLIRVEADNDGNVFSTKGLL